MSSPDLATAVIACPNCGTRYQVPRATLGATGREVQCAQCGKSWHAEADAPVPMSAPAQNDDDVLFSAAEEAALDTAFEAEAEAVEPAPEAPAPPSHDPERERTLAEIRAAIAPKPKSVAAMDPALLTENRRAAFDRRQAHITRRLPMARFRRTARLGALVALLSVLLLGYSLRTDIVRLFPALAGLYGALGLPVNVIGLAFEDPKTLTSFRDGKNVMLITARIRSVAGQAVPVPPVLVSLLDANGTPLYEWTVTPRAIEMDPGEVFDFSTEVNTPPEGAVTVRLSFTTARGSAAASAETS
ncbi:MAG: zinc-ribbon domain-containing protein [Devosia nanyangense]|uniref:Zinc-ribbon domain-containing protein n=1 Tax=Devosia nanyangense TaxID=1228055 RepID=A0A933P0L4_9HYPH|nr:zinc-ribbon domain-containing protein [Devosia nanyangense]